MNESRSVLRLDYCDFWPGFDKEDNWFASLLSQRYRLEISDTPELLLYSCFGEQYRTYNCKRVFVSWENRGWGFSQCDYAFTSDRLWSHRHRRLPLWVAWLAQPFVQPPIDPRAVLDGKRGFASLVVSNGAGPTRNRLYRQLDAYSAVASGGRYQNNVGGPVADKAAFISQYKFNLACENSSYPGYVTEKLLHGLQANTVPIYWGAPDVGLDFNTDRFINVNDFESDDALMDRIMQLDRDDDAYCEMIAQPWFPHGELPSCADLNGVLAQFDRIVSSPIAPVALRPALVRAPRAAVDRMRISYRSRTRTT